MYNSDMERFCSQTRRLRLCMYTMKICTLRKNGCGLVLKCVEQSSGESPKRLQRYNKLCLCILPLVSVYVSEEVWCDWSTACPQGEQGEAGPPGHPGPSGPLVSKNIAPSVMSMITMATLMVV